MTERILLLSNSTAIRKQVKDALAPRRVTARKVTVKTMPGRADAVVTKAAISSRIAFLSMSMGTGYVFVLPESVAALGEFVDTRPPREGGTDSIVLVGGDVAGLDPLAADKQASTDQEVIL